MLRKIRCVVAVFAVLLALPSFAQDSTWTIDTAHSGVEFQISHLGVSTVRGSFSGVTGTVVWNQKDPSQAHVETVIDAKTVSTGQAKRDDHLRSADFFDVAKFPTLTFKSTAVKRSQAHNLQIVGDLTLGGQTRPVTLDVDGPATPQKGMNGKLVSGFSATGVIKRSDFNFGQKYGAPVLGDEVKFTIDLEITN